MSETKTIVISVDVITNKTTEEVVQALKKGIYKGLDTAPNYIAPPKQVKINYCLTT